MPRKFRRILCLAAFALCVFWAQNASALGFEVFGKGSVSKSNLSGGDYVVSMSGAGGVGIILIPQLRLEGRFTLISQTQNHMNIGYPDPVYTLTDIQTRSYIYSVNIDFDILSDKHPFQPFIVAGAGYREANRTYNVSNFGVNNGIPISEEKDTSATAIAGGGFRLRVVRSLAFEIEALAYVLDPNKPSPVIDWIGTVGVRVFL